MGDFFRSDTGSLVEDNDEIEAAFLRGEVGLESGSTVNMVRSDGRVEEYRAEDAATMLQHGYRFERGVERQAREEEAAYDERNTEAAIAGAARGLTFGASDYLADATGIADRETLEKLQRYNPYVSGAGEAAGVIGGALLTGGAGGLSALRGGAAGASAAVGRAAEAAVAGTRLVQAAEAGGTLARAGAAAARLGAQGAAEGALYGAAARVNEDWLADREITTERIVAGTTLGALTGGAFGASAGVLSSLSSSAMQAASKHTLDSFMSQRAVKAVVGQTSKKQITLAGRHGETMEEGIEKVGREILDDWSEAGFNMKLASQEEIGAQARARTEFWGARMDDIEKRADNALLDAGEKAVDANGVASRIRKEVIEPLMADPTSRRTGRALEDRLKETLEYLDEQPSMSVEAARRMRVSMDKHMIDWSKMTSTVVDDEMKAARRVWENEIESAIKRSGMFDEYKQVKLRYSVNAWADKATQELAAGNLARRFVSPSDNLVGAAMGVAQTLSSGGVGLGTLVAGSLGSQANRVLRERASQFVAGSLYDLRKTSLFKQAVKSETALSDAAEGLVARAFRGGARLTAAIRDSGPVLGAKVILGDARTHEDAAQRIADLQNPDSFARSTMKMNLAPLAHVDPDGAAAIDAHVQRVADFLATKAGSATAASVGSQDAFARFKKPSHDAGSTARLRRYADAAEDPSRALARMQRGEVRREDVETLQALYPRMYQRFVAKVQADMANAKKRPSYESRVALSVALGAPVDKSMRPDVVRQLQLAAAPTDMERSELSPQKTRSGKSPNLASIYQTKNDRLTAGRMGS